MFRLIKSIVRLTLNIRRSAIALEKIATLYELQMNQAGIYIYDPKIKDVAEVSYPPNPNAFIEADPYDLSN
jgi:hypothetical protein